MECVIDLIDSSDDEQGTRVGSHGSRWNVKESEGGVIPLGTEETGLGSSPFHDSHCSHRRNSDVVLLNVKPPPTREQNILIPYEHSTDDTDDALSSDGELLFLPLGPLRQRLLDGMHRMEEPVSKEREVVNRYQRRRARRTDTLFIDSDSESRHNSKKEGKSFDRISPFCTVDMDNEDEIHCDSQNTAYGMEDLALDSTSQPEVLHVSPRQSLTGSSTSSSNYDHPVDAAVVSSFPATEVVACSDVIAGCTMDEDGGGTNISPLISTLTREIDLSDDEETNSNDGSNVWCNFVPLKRKGRETEDGPGLKAQRDEILKAKQEAKASARAQARAEKEMAKEAKALKKLKEKEAKALRKTKGNDEKKRKKLEIQAASGKFYEEEIVCIMDRGLTLRCPSLLEGTASQDGCTEKFEVRPSKEEEEMAVSGAVWWIRRPFTNQCNQTEIKKAMAVVIDDAVMFLDSLKDRPSPPNDYPGVEKIVDRILGCAKGRFDRVMLYLQGIEEEINYRIKANPVGEKGSMTMDDMEDVSAWLTIAKQTDLVITQSPNETAKHLWNLTKALAKDPYTETHTQISCTKVLSSWSVNGNVDKPILDIWLRQLGQIRGISEPKAQAIVKEYPSWRRLMMALQTSQNPYLLEDILSISGRKERALSRRVYEFMTNCDPDCII